MIIFNDRLKYLACLDPNCNGGQAYDVLSTYFDTDESTFYWQKVEGENLQWKVRTRCYGKDWDLADNYKIEYKQKYGDLQYKGSNSINAEEFIARDLSAFSHFFPRDLHGLIPFLKPIVMVYFKRLAYFIPDHDDALRINFDFSIKTFPVGDKEEFHEPDRFIVLEIKSAKNCLPEWLDDELFAMNIKRITFSKYINAYDNFISGPSHPKESVFGLF